MTLYGEAQCVAIKCNRQEKDLMRKQVGFTLIELMITVVVIGILAAIALPNYSSYIRRSHCENAKATILGAANLMERHRAQKNSYLNASLGSYAQSPTDGSEQFVLALTTSSPTRFKIVAIPTAMLSGKGTLVLESTGKRSATGEFEAIDAWRSCNGI